jgi:protein ImuB
MTLTAPVRALGLEAREFSPLDGATLTLFPETMGGAPDPGLLERLRARLGEAAVYGLQALPDHRPERAWRRCVPGEVGADCPSPERPLWLLAEPLPLQERQGRPWYQGRLELVGERERIECGWWDGNEVARDYFVAHTPAGARLWVYRELHPPGRWFLHGVFG